MNTEQLIDMLAARPAPVARRYVASRYASALTTSTGCALVAMLVALGTRPDLAAAIHLPMFWTKLSFVVAMATLGIVGVWRTSIPGRSVRGVWRGFAGAVASMWLVAAIVLFEAPPAARTALVLGDTWRVCPWLIAALSIPVFVAVVRFGRRMAPTDLRRAGAMAGFASGATAALVYSFHCPELAAPFLATWYLIGMLLPALAGWALGERLFRW